MQQSLLNLRPPTLTVSEITAHIRQILELDDILQDIWIQGEISNWSQAASGHIYFTLKDAKASVRCVVWRSTALRLSYRPQGSGEAILAHGRVSVYEVGGAYQFYVDDMQPAGLGALYAQFEQLRHRLDQEGLFDTERKRPLPEFPQRIGIVTSAQAAALQDVLNVLSRRYPLAEVILSPAPVQGSDAPPQLIAAFERLLALSPPVDLILVTRGGGSIEDLWAFNDEALVRTVAASPIPTVSGVGHETDFTLIDFVTDYRAPTPSAAAEVITPIDMITLKQTITSYQSLFYRAMLTRVRDARTEVNDTLRYMARLSPQKQVDNWRQQVDDAVAHLGRQTAHNLTLQRERMTSAAARLKTLDPTATLARGYAIVQKKGQLVASVDEVKPGDQISVTLKDGQFEATVD